MKKVYHNAVEEPCEMGAAFPASQSATKLPSISELDTLEICKLLYSKVV